MNIPSLGNKEAEILRLLITKGEMYGLEMVNASDQLKRGTVYVVLGRMAEKGFVESRQVEPAEGGGLPRRLYRITGLGVRVLRAREAAAATWEVSWAPA